MMDSRKVPVYLGKVTYIIDLDYFYMHIGTAEQLEDFSLIESKISDFGMKSVCIDSISDLTDGHIVVVDCQKSYGCWRRGQVTRIDSENNTADVFYIDYGETENIGEDRICANLSPEISAYPSQALRCSLAGIRPIAKQWTRRASKTFDKYTKIRIFNTIILKAVNGTFKVVLYSKDEKQRCLSSILVDEELGFPIEDELTEYFKDADEFYSTRLQEIQADTYKAYKEWENGVQIVSDCNLSEDADEGEFSEEDGIDDNNDVDQQYVSFDSDKGDHSPYPRNNIGIKSFSSPAKSPLSNQRQQNVSSPLGALFEKISKSSDKSSTSSLNSSPSLSMMGNLCSAIESTGNPRNKNNSNRQADPLSPQMIPQFNMDYLHKTQVASTDKLLEKVHKETREACKIEQARVKKETKEQSELAVLAGYGGIEDDASSQKSTPEKPKDLWKICSGDKEDWDKELLSGSPGPALKDILPPPVNTRESAHGRELLKVLNQIFNESEREPVEEIRVRLVSLFKTDSYLYLNKEELTDVLNTILNRAVRYYGVVHDVILEIIEILSGTHLFQECLLEATKRIQDTYIKIQYKGKPFHVQCSKVIGFIFNMSFHWMNSVSLQEYVASLLEKWIMFNKQGRQIGIDTLQEIYLESFEAIWEICGEALLDTVKGIKPRLLGECKDKILNRQISQNIRERTLQIYLMLNLKSGMIHRKSYGVQASAQMLEVSCQTEENTGSTEENTTLFNVPVKFQKTNRPPFYPPKSSSYYKQGSRSSTPSSGQSEESWPTLPKIHTNMPLLKKESPSANRVYSKTVGNQQIVPKTKQMFLDNKLHTSDITEPVYLLPPASFSDTEPPIDNHSSQEDSSLHFSMNENSNNCSLLSFNDTLNITASSQKGDKDLSPNLAGQSREVSPLARLIQMDVTTNFYQTDNKKNDLEPRQLSSHNSQAKDWWNPEDEPKVIQSKVKDNWYDSDTSESVSVKSEKIPPNSSENIVETHRGTLHSSKQKSYGKKYVSSPKKDETQKLEYSPQRMNTGLNHVNQLTSESTGANIQNLENKSTTNAIDENTKSRKLDVDVKDDTNQNIDDFDDDDNEDDWESYTESTDENLMDINKKSGENYEVGSKVSISREYLTEKKPTWKPGVRKCTVCGDTSHLIYDCPNKHKQGMFY